MAAVTRQREEEAEPRFEPFAYVRDEEAEELRAAAVREGAHAPARRSVRRGFSVLPLLGVLAAGYLLVAAMSAQARMLDISAKSARVQQRIEELEAEQARLRIAREGALNLAEIEAYATGVLGMHPPDEGQIEYIEPAFPDRAELPARAQRDGFVDRASDFLFRLWEYLAWEGE